MSIKCKPHHSQAGFTIVELLVAMALMGALLTIITQIFSSVSSVRNETKVNSAVTQDGQFLLTRFAYDISRASAVTTPSSYGGAGSSSLVLTISGSSYTYAVSSGNLQLTVGVGSPDVLNSSDTTVSGFTAIRYGNGGSGNKDTVRLTFTLTSKRSEQKGAKTQTFTLTKGLR